MKVGYQSKEKYVVWHVEGGLGKNVAATALVPSIKGKYPDRKLIMTVSYPEVFLNNPLVDRVYSLNKLTYFYEDYIEGKDTIIFRQEGYHQSAHIHKKQHLIKSWCDLLELEYRKQTPQLFFNLVQQRIVSLWKTEKPTLLLHTNGGPLQDEKVYSWTRDIPPYIGQQIVEKYKDKYRILQVCRNELEILPGVDEAYYQSMTNYELFTLVASTDKRVLIDSSLQHIAAALELPSTVLWIGTSPKLFGYDQHSNIEANPPAHKPKLIDSYLFDYSFSGEVAECPYYSVEEIFDLDKIYNSIDKV